MTMVQTIKNVDLMRAAIAFAPPISDGLVGWWYPGVDSTITTKDFTFTDNAAVIGAPTYSAGYVTCTGLTNYLQTALPETIDYSILAVVRYPSGQASPNFRGAIGGNWESGHASKGLYSTSGTYPATNINLNPGKSSGGSNAAATLNVTDASDSFMVAATVDDTAGTYAVRNLTAGTVASGTLNGDRQIDGAGTWMFGSFPFTWNGEIDIAHFSLWDRALSTGEMATLRTFIASFMLDRRSITI